MFLFVFHSHKQQTNLRTQIWNPHKIGCSCAQYFLCTCGKHQKTESNFQYWFYIYIYIRCPPWNFQVSNVLSFGGLHTTNQKALNILCIIKEPHALEEHVKRIIIHIDVLRKNVWFLRFLRLGISGLYEILIAAHCTNTFLQSRNIRSSKSMCI